MCYIVINVINVNLIYICLQQFQYIYIYIADAGEGQLRAEEQVQPQAVEADQRGEGLVRQPRQQTGAHLHQV